MPRASADLTQSGAWLYATYSFESRLSPEEAAHLLAAEQSTGHDPRSFSDAGRDSVVSVYALSDDSIILAYRHDLIASIPSLLALLQGEALELSVFESLRLTGIEVSEDMAEFFAGPRYGISGLRQILGVADRPLVAAILKPSVGLEPRDAAELAVRYAAGGADLIKDDELSILPYRDLAERCREVSKALHLASVRLGRPVVYVCNITGPLDELESRAALCRAFENVWPMICEYSAGLDALRRLRECSGRPILCHRAGAGAAIRSQRFGMTQSAQVTLSRLAGADLVHCGSFRGKLFDSEAEVSASVEAASKPVKAKGERYLNPSMPLIGGGFGPREARITVQNLGRADVCFVFGASVAFSEQGPESAIAQIRQALETVHEES